MADNFTTNAGSGGETFASDDVGGVQYPISKLGHGALDSVTLVSTSSGLPVQQQGTWNIATLTTLTGITNDVNIADGGNSITVDDGG